MFSPFLKRSLLPLLQAMILRLDSQAFAPLKPHEDKILAIEIQGFAPVILAVKAQGFDLIDLQAEKFANTTFSGRLSHFIQGLTTQHLQSGLIEIKGDLALAQAFSAVWQQLDCDWEGLVASLIGDPLAMILSETWLSSQSTIQKNWSTRQQDLGAYLQDEIQLLPLPSEVDEFLIQIDAIRSDVERLEARVHRLRKLSLC